LRALALALKDDDRMVHRVVGSRITRPSSMDLGVAVEVDDGVLTPVIRTVDQLDLAKLTTAVDLAVENARKGRVGDIGGAVSTITNYGTFGLTWATAIPQPDHSMILGIGAVRYVPDWNPAEKRWDRAREAELTIASPTAVPQRVYSCGLSICWSILNGCEPLGLCADSLNFH
jgi:pyruvate/2-oxoglutarate dehydrogenase complex dihydrolipoamide acyltransferase (E2) component